MTLSDRDLAVNVTVHAHPLAHRMCILSAMVRRNTSGLCDERRVLVETSGPMFGHCVMNDRMIDGYQAAMV